MKKILAFTLSIILAGTALAGCEDTDSASEVNDTSSISESSETATESATTSEAEKTFFEMYYDLNFTYEATDYYMMFEERFNKFLDEVRNNEKFKNKAKDIGFLHKKFRCFHFSEEDMVSRYEWGIFDIDITRNRDIGIEKITSGAVNYIYSDKYDIETTEDLVLFHLIPYAVIYDYSIDDLIEFRDKLIVNPIKKINEQVTYEYSDEKVKCTFSRLKYGRIEFVVENMTKPEYDKKHFIDEGTNEFISNANPEDETRVKTALYVTSFQSSSSYYPMYDLLNDTFKNFTLDIELTDSNPTLGYYEYNVTVSGDYYANTADKNSGITSSGDMEFVIVYIDNELNTCTVAVKDIWGDVYQAMANILFNL